MSGKQMIIGIAVIVVLQMAFTFVFMTFLMKKDKNQENVEQVSEDQEKDNKSKNDIKNEEDNPENETKEAKDYIKEYAIFNHAELTDLVVNIQNSEGRFLMITMGFEYKQADKKLPDELNSQMIIIKDKLLESLAARSIKDLGNIEYRNQLKEDIMKIVNSRLTSGQVTSVLFTNYVIQ